MEADYEDRVQKITKDRFLSDQDKQIRINRMKQFYKRARGELEKDLEEKERVAKRKELDLETATKTHDDVRTERIDRRKSK